MIESQIALSYGQTFVGKDDSVYVVLKRIYETIKNRTLDLPNFRKTFLRDYVSSGKVIDLEKTVISKGKPARLYKLIEE